MNHLFTTPELGMLTIAGKLFKKQTNLNVDTYCYIASRIYEAALKGETSATVSGEGLSGIQEIADVINGTLINGVYIYWYPESNEISMSWRESY